MKIITKIAGYLILVALLSWFVFSLGEVVYHSDHHDYEYSDYNIFTFVFDKEA